jgi:hypothetical protein
MAKVRGSQFGLVAAWVKPVWTDSKFKRFKYIKKVLNFGQTKKYFPVLRKLEIKYGLEGFEERNKFLNRNFFRFKVKFK